MAGWRGKSSSNHQITARRTPRHRHRCQPTIVVGGLAAVAVAVPGRGSSQRSSVLVSIYYLEEKNT